MTASKPPYSPSGEGSETAENVTYHPAAEAASDARATGVRLPEPTRCQREDEDGPCIVQAESCTCRVPFGCAEDYPGCCFCVHMDVYHPCPTFGFGCGPGCDCCTPYQQRQVFRQAQPRPLSKPEDYYEPDPFADDDAQPKASEGGRDEHV